MSENSVNPSVCYICREDYTDRETQLYYCLCDTAVCVKCIEKVKVDDKNWKCPKCNQIMDLESTRLFREHIIE